MGHVVTLIGGVHVDFKTAEQSGPVYRPVPKARQKAALQFITENVIRTPDWLVPENVVARIGPPVGAAALATRQATIVGQLLDIRRLNRLAESAMLDDANAYPLAEYLGDLRGAVWGSPGTGAAPDANRRVIHRVYLERLEALITPPAAPTGGQGPGGGGAAQQAVPLLAMPNVQRTDLPALARSQVRAIREDARRAAATSPAGVIRSHWQDIADRADRILEPRRR